MFHDPEIPKETGECSRADDRVNLFSPAPHQEKAGSRDDRPERQTLRVGRSPAGPGSRNRITQTETEQARRDTVEAVVQNDLGRTDSHDTDAKLLLPRVRDHCTPDRDNGVRRPSENDRHVRRGRSLFFHETNSRNELPT